MSDPYLEGFQDGRLSMARALAHKLSGSMAAPDLASLLGISTEQLEALLVSAPPRPEESADSPENEKTPSAQSFPRSPITPIPGHNLVEPAFVRTLRAARSLTQNDLARLLGVHPHTICEWETAPHPVRIKAETYAKLSEIAMRNVPRGEMF